MGKIGRNEPCPCGSVKKYKKCCIDKPDKSYMNEGFVQYLQNFMTYEEVNNMSTNEIIQRLESIGIAFDQEVFLRDVENFYSAQQLSQNWLNIFRVRVKGRDEDFPWFAAWILWERLAPAHILSREQMSELIKKGFEYLSINDSQTACNLWLKVWESLKYRFNPEYKNLDFLDSQYKGSFFIRNFCQDLECELQNAGLKNKFYFEKRIHFCKEFLENFPGEEELMIHNMRRNIAESYSSLGDYEQTELEFKKLVQDFPNNPWGYIGWGDMYYLDQNQNYAAAKELYKKALAVAKDEMDIDAVQERLEDLENDMRSKQ